MPLVQLRDVPEETVAALKAHAAAQGITMAALIRAELERNAARPTNAQIVERMLSRDRSVGPTMQQTVSEIRRLRESS